MKQETDSPAADPAQPDALRQKPTLAMAGFLVVTMIIGYEWFVSGLVKFVRGDFPSGLGIKNSDYGRELGDSGIQAFVNKKLVRIGAIAAPA